MNTQLEEQGYEKGFANGQMDGQKMRARNE